ncbi:MAG: MalY/PatB family protein [Chloroflexota bacterium]
MKYDFDTVINRCGTNSAKWDGAEDLFHVKDILPMWVADMDFRLPQPILDALKEAADHGIFGYTRVGASYYEALLNWMKKRHQWDIQKEWVAFSAGVVPAIRILIKAFTQPGDQVIVQTPVYYPFFNAIKDNGCEILDNPLRLENGQYTMDFADLESKISPRAKIFLLCSPHNPISRVWQEEELRALGEICLKHNILVIADEIHHDIVYPGFKHTILPTIEPEFADKSIVCTSASKTFNLAGLKMSNIIIPEAGLRDRFCTVARSCGHPSPNIFGLVATEAALRYGEAWLDQLLEYLQGNIDFLTKYVAEKIPGLKVMQPQGTYLLWLDFRDCGIDPARLGSFVREEAKVGLEPGTRFGCTGDGFERMNIACPRSILAEGLSRIEKTVNRLKAD